MFFPPAEQASNNSRISDSAGERFNVKIPYSSDANLFSSNIHQLQFENSDTSFKLELIKMDVQNFRIETQQLHCKLTFLKNMPCYS